MEIHAFSWNEDNIEHISNHGVTPEEIEEIVFEGTPYIRKGKQGKRYLYGKTVGGRYLFVVYVPVGKAKVRVVTARDMDAKEKRLYLKRGK
jgi:hypothetical protein